MEVTTMADQAQFKNSLKLPQKINSRLVLHIIAMYYLLFTLAQIGSWRLNNSKKQVSC